MAIPGLYHSKFLLEVPNRILHDTGESLGSFPHVRLRPRFPPRAVHTERLLISPHAMLLTRLSSPFLRSQSLRRSHYLSNRPPVRGQVKIIRLLFKRVSNLHTDLSDYSNEDYSIHQDIVLRVRF
ncbi:hypothetical protein CDAR_589301 [Caerostris darwini]|uniref:Uncharacterized protein n=1 Tax=Caerostris darwini TaxID=1538125 RepID=A0AAV4T9L1_9ARAC|nr:hypothetical protein CDAR_589301 [Caerostris darwini]